VAPVSRQPLINQADQAFGRATLKGQAALQRRGEKTNDYNQKIYCYITGLASFAQSPATGAQAPGHPAQMTQGSPWPVGQTASFTQTAPAPAKLIYPPQWTQPGILRRAAFDKDGQPTYVLQDAKGNVLMYATCPPGMTLRDYVGRTVALYGSINYRSDDYLRTHFHDGLPRSALLIACSFSGEP